MPAGATRQPGSAIVLAVPGSEHPTVVVESREAWRAWLAEHHATSPGAWVVTHKKSSGGPYVSYDDLVEEALCFGWVDSRSRSVDARRTSLLVTPRRPRSRWSASNVARVERLTAAGLMAPAGLAAVEAARAEGTWPWDGEDEGASRSRHG